jgi:hypothetical protein
MACVVVPAWGPWQVDARGRLADRLTWGWVGAWLRCLSSVLHSFPFPLYRRYVVYLSLHVLSVFCVWRSWIDPVPISPFLGYLYDSCTPISLGIASCLLRIFNPFSTVCVMPTARLNVSFRPVLFCSPYVCRCRLVRGAGLALPFLAVVQHPVKNKLFATVPESSINSWDSWFIFNLRKINTCCYTDTTCTLYRDGDCWS